MSTFSFAAERYDRLSNTYFDYVITYYKTQGGNEVEVIESKSKRRFAHRGRTDLVLPSLFVGGKVIINASQFTVTDYNDSATRKTLAPLHETTLAVVHGPSFNSLGKILTAATGFGFSITKLQTVTVTAAVQGVLRGAGLSRVATGPAVFIGLLRPNAVEEWQKLKSRFGSPDDVHASESVEAAQEEIDHIFNSDLGQKTSARCSKRSSLCLIKPHAVAAGHAGAIVQLLADNLNVTAAEMVHLNKEDSLEFLTCYRGVLPNFSAQVEALYVGPAIAVEVCDDSGGGGGGGGGPDGEEVDVVGALRQVAGPFDVMCAKCLAPETIRALYGVSNVENAVHVTDLPTDGQIETNFFFRVLKT